MDDQIVMRWRLGGQGSSVMAENTGCEEARINISGVTTPIGVLAIRMLAAKNTQCCSGRGIREWSTALMGI
jgi:hypothetical protein